MNVSVAMCTFNGARFLPEQLASLVEQTRPPDELIICDDSSTDDTGTLLERFTKDAPFPVHLHYNQVNLGSTKNFEQAIRYCRGEIIALCDQDDVWYPEKIERTEALFNARPDVGMVFADAEVVDKDGSPQKQTLWQIIDFGPDLQKLVRSQQAFKVFFKHTVATGATMSFRSNFRDILLPIPGKASVIHDAWIALIISSIAPVEIIESPLIKYRSHPNQQIGARHRELSSHDDEDDRMSILLNSARRKNSYEPEIEKLRALSERLATTKTYLSVADAADLKRKLNHLQTRASISGKRIINAPYVLKEICMLRYHRYSNGFGSALKDLLC
jgi:glycosyltransferase involved in cell wall biosynthesis